MTCDAVNHLEVQKILDEILPEQRSPGHGKCVEPQCYSKALSEGKKLKGSEVLVKKVRKQGDPKHGESFEACASCKVLNERLGVKDVAKE